LGDFLDSPDSSIIALASASAHSSKLWPSAASCTWHAAGCALRVPDNLRSAILSHDRYEAQVKPTYPDLAKHYGTGSSRRVSHRADLDLHSSDSNRLCSPFPSIERPRSVLLRQGRSRAAPPLIRPKWVPAGVRPHVDLSFAPRQRFMELAAGRISGFPRRVAAQFLHARTLPSSAQTRRRPGGFLLVRSQTRMCIMQMCSTRLACSLL
jgi:hypothetical protein